MSGSVLNRVWHRVRSLAKPETSWWSEEEGRARFNVSGISTAPANWPESAAMAAYEGRQLTRLLRAHANETTTSLEIGCGYGRLTGWIAPVTTAHHAIDAEEAMVSEVNRYYPNVDVKQARADALPFADETMDVVTTWSVLQHVHPRQIADATDEIMRVLSNDGVVIMAEETHPDRAGDVCWPRSVDKWSELFSDLELVTTEERDCGPQGPDECGSAMVFQAYDSA